MSDGKVYRTTIQCHECFEHFDCEFSDPSESFSATCPNCNTHYPELYV